MSLLPLVAVVAATDDERMFSVHCEAHGTEVLLTTDAISAVVNDGSGITVHWRCSCGQRGSFRTGRVRRAPDTVLAA